MHVCLDFGFCVRRSVYFLNICYIRVFYRFNRNRALQVGIRAVVSPCPDAIGNELLSMLVLLCCCSYLLVGFM
jgi:hypothetical protein